MSMDVDGMDEMNSDAVACNDNVLGASSFAATALHS
jgi:hypothetical protein